MPARLRKIGIATGDATKAVATFYREVFDLTGIDPSSPQNDEQICLSDGTINLVFSKTPVSANGRIHLGFAVENAREVLRSTEGFGGKIETASQPGLVRIFDPVGTPIDLFETADMSAPCPSESDRPVIQHIGMTTGDAVATMATFYKELFGLEETHSTSHERDRSEVYLSDGNVSLALATASSRPRGRIHFGFRVEDNACRVTEATKFGGSLNTAKREKARPVEVGVLDPIGLGVDLSTRGWRLSA